MPNQTQILILPLIILIELIYFKIANHFNIFDKPNHRSSHNKSTIRGGGIVFTLSILLYSFIFGNQFQFFLIGLVIIATVSFIDDLTSINNRVRILFHLVSVGLMFYQIGFYIYPIYIIAIALFIVIGIINAVNFMDGINGITGIYALVALCSLLYVDKFLIDFTEVNLIVTVILAVSVFGFFNFRTKAKCFAGDVGSVGIAFILVFLLLQLILLSKNPTFLILLLIYGLDTVTTIIFRLIRGENIFEAHRSHFYQYLSNERNVPQLYVAISYGVIQLIVNVLFILVFKGSFIFTIFFTAILGLIFIGIRFYTEGRERLLG
ncbi:MAG: UDP-GlcNAc--UDP-phosphate GlcNAc-1-phosphate transferase [Bacteroidota bacterium]